MERPREGGDRSERQMIRFEVGRERKWIFYRGGERLGATQAIGRAFGGGGLAGEIGSQLADGP